MGAAGRRLLGMGRPDLGLGGAVRRRNPETTSQRRLVLTMAWSQLGGPLDDQPAAPAGLLPSVIEHPAVCGGALPRPRCMQRRLRVQGMGAERESGGGAGAGTVSRRAARSGGTGAIEIRQPSRISIQSKFCRMTDLPRGRTGPGARPGNAWPGCATLWGRRGDLRAVRRSRLLPAAGDWLSGRAPRSHRGGHWFDPSIAHQRKHTSRAVASESVQQQSTAVGPREAGRFPWPYYCRAAHPGGSSSRSSALRGASSTWPPSLCGLSSSPSRLSASRVAADVASV